MSTILFVDDAPDVRMALEAVLTKLGHDTVVAENGRQAMELFHANTPDLVLTDLVMPQMSGIDLIYAIRQSSPHLPIIAISGGGGGAAAADILEEAEFAGADICLNKPVLTEELREAIDTLLSAGPASKTAAE